MGLTQPLTSSNATNLTRGQAPREERPHARREELPALSPASTTTSTVPVAGRPAREQLQAPPEQQLNDREQQRRAISEFEGVSSTWFNAASIDEQRALRAYIG